MADIAKALTGHDRPEHILALKPALALYDAYTERLRECDAEIALHFQRSNRRGHRRAATGRLGGQTPVTRQECPAYNAHHTLFQLMGVDLVTIPGLKASTVQTPSRKLAWICRSGPMRRRSVHGWRSRQP